MPSSRAYRAAAILPSIPRSPNPPGITMPSRSFSRPAPSRPSTSSAEISSMSTFAPWKKPEWLSDSMTER